MAVEFVLPSSPRKIDSRWQKLFGHLKRVRVSICGLLVVSAVLFVAIPFMVPDVAMMHAFFWAAAGLNVVMSLVLWAIFSARLQHMENLVINGTEIIATVVRDESRKETRMRHLEYSFECADKKYRARFDIMPSILLEEFTFAGIRKVAILIDRENPKKTLPISSIDNQS